HRKKNDNGNHNNNNNNNNGNKKDHHDNNDPVVANKIRDKMDNDFGKKWKKNHDDMPFQANFWNKHNHDHEPWCFHNDNHWHNDAWYWWAPCSVVAIGGWCAYDNWSHPCYWDYGPDEYIYYRDNYVYVDGQQYLPATDYYAQLSGLAH